MVFANGNIMTIIVIIIIAVLFVISIVNVVKNRKKGKHLCGGDCSRCSGCGAFNKNE